MRLRVACSVVLTLGLGWVGCSTDSGVEPPRSTGGTNAGGDGGTSAAGQPGSGGGAGSGAAGSGGQSTGGSSTGGSGGGSTGGSSTGASGGSSGDGGSPPIDASYPDVVFTYDGAGGTGPVTQDSACASVSETASVERQPVDIIFVVDNSGSMNAEVGFVRQNMNAFSQQIINSGIDVHVVLISAPSSASNGICIAAPLGSGNCPDDTNLPTYLHVNQTVGSSDGLQLVLNTYAQWQGAMRANAPKHLVIVTDDDSDLNATNFDTQFKALHSSHSNYKLHAIYGFTKPDVFSCLLGSNDPCCGGLTADIGTVYRTLVAQTAGVEGNLCLQNFGPVFNTLASSVIAGTPINCEFPMPRPQTGVVNPDDVSLEFQLTPTSAKQSWTRVSGAGACTSTGFYYDTTPNPTKIILCPQACTTAQQASNPTITVLLGCLGS